MEGRPMRNLRQRGLASAAAWPSPPILLVLGKVPLRAEDKAASKPLPSPLSAALQITRTHGAATVAILTCSEQPSSERLWKEFYAGAWARANRGLIQVVNVSKEAEPELVRALGVSRFPTVVVYGRGPRGVGQLGTIADCDTVDALVGRLRSLDLGLNPPARTDRAVSQAAFGGDVYATQQAQCAPPAYCPPVTTAPPQPQPTTVSLAPSVSQSVQAMASMVQIPSQNLMIQQAPPQVFLAPAQTPIVYVPQAMPAAAASPATVASAPPANLFMAMPSVLSAAAPDASANDSGCGQPSPSARYCCDGRGVRHAASGGCD